MKNILTLFIAFSLTQAIALNPSRTYKQMPDKYNMEYVKQIVKTNDGNSTLNTWYFPANTKTTKLILIAHNGEGNMADYLRRVHKFTGLGYNVLTFDYRGYGQSSDFEIDNNMYIYPHFQDDVNTMIDFCRKNYVANFSIYGWGIGGGLAMGIGWNRSEITHIISDSPFLSMADLETNFEDWDQPMEVPFAGYKKKYEPIHALDNPFVGKTKKIMLIAGSNDIICEKEDLTRLKAKNKKVITDVIIIDNPDRKDNFRINKDNYMSRIKTFLMLAAK